MKYLLAIALAFNTLVCAYSQIDIQLIPIPHVSILDIDPYRCGVKAIYIENADGPYHKLRHFRYYTIEKSVFGFEVFDFGAGGGTKSIYMIVNGKIQSSKKHGLEQLLLSESIFSYNENDQLIEKTSESIGGQKYKSEYIYTLGKVTLLKMISINTGEVIEEYVFEYSGVDLSRIIQTSLYPERNERTYEYTYVDKVLTKIESKSSYPIGSLPVIYNMEYLKTRLVKVTGFLGTEAISRWTFAY